MRATAGSGVVSRGAELIGREQTIAPCDVIAIGFMAPPEVRTAEQLAYPKAVGGDDARGGFCGEMALVDGKPRSANATALEHVTLRAIPGSTLRRKLADTDPFVRALVRILVQNLRTTTEGTGGG